MGLDPVSLIVGTVGSMILTKIMAPKMPKADNTPVDLPEKTDASLEAAAQQQRVNTLRQQGRNSTILTDLQDTATVDPQNLKRKTLLGE